MNSTQRLVVAALRTRVRTLECGSEFEHAERLRRLMRVVRRDPALARDVARRMELRRG